MSLIVNEKRLPSTIKRLFKNSVSEIVGELLQNAQRAGAREIHFTLDREAKRSASATTVQALRMMPQAGRGFC